MKLFLRIFFPIFTMITAVGEVQSSTVVTTRKVEILYSLNFFDVVVTGYKPNSSDTVWVTIQSFLERAPSMQRHINPALVTFNDRFNAFVSTSSMGLSGSAPSVAAKTGTQLTAHGAERIAGATATRGGVLSMEGVNATKSLGRAFTQADGAKVFLHEITPGRFNVVVEGNRGIITTMSNWSQSSIDRIARNYGWIIK